MVGLALVLLVLVRAFVGISRLRTWMREQDPRPVVAIANRADGGFAYWIGKLYGFAVLVACASAVLVGTILYSYFSSHTPATRDLRAYPHAVPAVSRIYAA